MNNHYYLMYNLPRTKTNRRRTPIDPRPDILTSVRNQASTRVHWFSLLGGKAVTAPCEERINDNYMLKIYDPGQEKKRALIKSGIAVALGALVGLIIGRWWGKRSERKARERYRQRMDWSDKKKVRRRLHARDWTITNIENP